MSTHGSSPDGSSPDGSSPDGRRGIAGGLASRIAIDRDRLLGDLASLAEEGRAPPGASGASAGWTRPALTDADARARGKMIARMRQAGLEIRRDEVGNLRARRPGRDMTAAPVWTGSHLDSVPTGGHLDGPLGVAGALAAVEALDRAGIETERPIEIVVFVGEEGSRFPRGTIGSAAVAGHVAVSDVLALRDEGGVTYAQALATYGDEAAGLPLLAARAERGAIHAFVELHIEQGGVLEAEGVEVGAVTAIAGLVQRSITFTGEANHAGTTPMHLRRDALLAAAEWALAVERIAAAEGGTGTVGKLDVLPGGKNIIPGRVEAICDLRAADARALSAIDDAVVAALQQAARRHVAVQQRRLQRVEPQPMDERMVAAVERGAAALGLRSRRMPSGAIHDALHMAEACPASMIFVPSLGGKSHCPEEASRPEHLAHGAAVLAAVLADLAGAPR